jgi:hypothetical protein
VRAAAFAALRDGLSAEGEDATSASFSARVRSLSRYSARSAALQVRVRFDQTSSTGSRERV